MQADDSRDARRHGEEGQTMVEYSLVLSVITALVIASMAALAGGVERAIDRVIGLIPA